jgi:hypothetical protein
MSCSTETAAGAVTAAFSVAKFTTAVTSGMPSRVFSTLAAQAAHVIPPIDSSICRKLGAAALLVVPA